MLLDLSGLPLTGTDALGVRWSAQRDKTVVLDSPGPKGRSTPRVGAHGVWVGDIWLDAARPVIGGYAYAADESALSAARDRLTSAVGVSDSVLTITEGSVVRSLSVRRDGPVMWQVVTPGDGRIQAVAEWSVQLVAQDPRLKAATLSVEVRLPSTSGGLTWPVTWPVTWTDVTQTGEGSLTNPGNVAGPVRLRLDGPSNPADPPLVGPVVTHVSSGQRLVFASSLTLAHGEFVTVDMERREVLAQGIEPRNGWVLRSAANFGWAAFQPGANVWSFTAQAASASALLTVEADPAWQ